MNTKNGLNKMTCDFCGEESERLERVALDKGYDRLTLKHQKKYACSKCSEKKEIERTTNKKG